MIPSLTCLFQFCIVVCWHNLASCCCAAMEAPGHTERNTALQTCMLVQFYFLFAICSDTNSCCCASRKIPGYPKIDTHNDYFLARFDGALIDGQSWGRGRPTLGPTSQHVDSQSRNTHHAMLAQLHQKEVWVPRCSVAVSLMSKS